MMRRLLPSRLNSALASRSQRRRAWLALWAQDRRRGRLVASAPAGPSLLDGLLAYWKLDEEWDEFGSDRADAHGPNTLYEVDYSGGMYGGTVGHVAGVLGNGAQPGAVGGEWPEQNYGLSPNVPVVDVQQDFTLSFWLKRNEEYSSHLVSQAEGFILHVRELYSGSALGVEWYAEGYEPYQAFSFSTVIPHETWTHVVISRAGNALTAYVDGVADPVIGTITVTPNTYGPLVIGPSWWGYSWGFEAFDEFGVWQRALSADEVNQLYNGGSGLAYELF